MGDDGETVPEQSHGHWHELLDQLIEELPQLAAQYVERVSGVVGYEPGGLIARDDLYGTAVNSIGALLESMRSGRVEERLLEFAEALGRRRADQQVRPSP